MITETVFTIVCTSIIMCFAQHVDINVLYLFTCIYFKKCNIVDEVVARVCFVKWLCDAIVGKSNGFFLVKYNHVQRKKEK